VAHARSWRRLFLFVGLGTLLALGGAAGALYLDLKAKFDAPGPLTAPLTLVLEKGAGAAAIAAALEAKGVIRSARVFLFGAWREKAGAGLLAGEYAFEAGMSAHSVLEKLRRGEVVIHRFTLAEGVSSAEAMAVLNATELLRGMLSDLPAEGSLLPDTYHFVLGDSRADLVHRMTAAMRALLAQSWSKRAHDLPLQSPEEALVLASIVEKETGLPEERPLIAGVFANRLKRGMPLQSDPTVIYALTAGRAPLGRPLTHADLATDSPFNTYARKGLPPAPIANPGRDAIAAVLNPAPTDALYFVADGSGGHAFARTLEEHNRNVARARKRGDS
jgi:UPF0755 protein